jgi:hypothetical protein
MKKKRLIAGVVLVLAATSAFGCGKLGLEPEAPSIYESLDNTEKEASSGADATSDAEKESEKDAATDNDATGDKQGYSGDEIAFRAGRNSMSNTVYSFDENGNKTSEYDLDEAEKALKDNGYEDDTNSFLTVHDGIIYYLLCDYSSSDYKYELVAYDPGTKEVKKFFESEYGEYIPTVDIYKGRIYVLLSKESNGSFKWRLKCFEKDKDSLSYTEKETEHADVYSYFSDYNINYVERLCREDDGPERILDETGFLIGRKDEAYYLLYPDKTVKKIDAIEYSNGGVKGFDEKSILHIRYRENYDFTTSGYDLIDIATQQTRELDLPDSAVCLYYRDGKLLYYVKDGQEYGKEDITLYLLDVESGKTTELIKRNLVLGLHYFSPIIENFKAVEGRAFFTDIVNGETRVYSAELGKDEFEVQDLECVVDKSDIFDYGTVGCVSVTSTCKFCGKPTAQGYAEYMIFDGSKVQNADKINQQLKSYAEGSVSYYENYDPDDLVHEDGCDHDEDYSFTVTNDENIGSINVLENRYITVNLEGYWYGGGAHGMPSRNQYMFDMTTGEEVTFKDLYKGTEEQLKALVATKVKEDYESYTGDNYPPYFMNSAQEAYDTAYDYASLGGLITFSEDGVIYTFYPYDLASYADGFKEYLLTYEEVFGRGTIAE